MPDDAPSTEPVYMIGVAAQLTGLHPQTVRMYERIGLITPSRVSNKNRLYSDADVGRLRQIRRLTQEMGVNLAGVEIILDLIGRIERLQQDLTDLRSHVQGAALAVRSDLDAP